MKEEPKISIIVPVYNSEAFIEKCIDSICNQSFKNIEVILIDDCSTDNSYQLCLKHAQKDKRITCFRQSKNSGVSAARNKGIEMVNGEYVMFADSDDTVDKEWCLSMLDCQLANPGSLIISNVCKTDEIGCCKLVYDVTSNNIIRDMSYYELYTSGLSGYPCNKIFKRSILNDHQVRFNEKLVAGEDVDFCCRYIAFINDIKVILKPLYFYLYNSNSVTKNYHEEELKWDLKSFMVRIPLIKEESELNEYCDKYFNVFVRKFNNIFDERCKRSLIGKFKFNDEVMKSKEFRFCCEHLSGRGNSRLFIWIVKQYNYYLFWMFQRIAEIKN